MNKSSQQKNKMILQNGVTIVEVMVSITVGLFILAGVIQLYASSTQNAAVVSGSSTIQENARYIFSRLANDVSQAGFGGCFNLTTASLETGKAQSRFASIVNSATTSGELYNFDHYIEGRDNDPDIPRLHFDSVTIRYSDSAQRFEVSAHIAPTFTIRTISDFSAQNSTFKQGDIVLVTNCSRMAMFRVSNDPRGSGTIEYSAADVDGVQYNSSEDLGADFEVVANVNLKQSGFAPVYLFNSTSSVLQYRIDTSAAGAAAGQSCAADNPEYCALFRKTAPTGKGDELVEGVEAFEVEYGWRDHVTGTAYFVDATEVENQDKWNLVDRVKINITFNSIDKVPTNVGLERIKRTYSQIFLVRNQYPSDIEMRTEPDTGIEVNGDGDDL